MTAQQRSLARLAVVAGLAGALSAVPMGGVLRALLLLVLLIAGAGSAALCWVDVPVAAAVAGVIGLSIAAVVALATTLAWLQLWYPIPSCLVLSVVVAGVGALRLFTGRRTNVGVS